MSVQPAPQPDANAYDQRAGLRQLRRKILILAVLPLVASLTLLALAVRDQAHGLSLREREVVEAAYLATKELELRNHVDVAMSVIAPIYEAGRDDAAAKREAARILNSMRYGNGDGYFFAYEYSGKNLVLPAQPELVGTNLWEVRDRHGKPVVQDLIRLAQAGGGFYRYDWNKPSQQSSAPKVGYVVGLPRWGWMLGTGVYLDDIQATLDKLDQQVSDHIWTTMLWIAGIALLAVSFVAGSALALNLSAHRAADAQLQLMARQVVASQESERAHLARELHDGTSQTLVSIKLLIDSAINALPDIDTLVTKGLLDKAKRRVSEALAEVRQLSHRLRPVMLDTLGLPSALQHLGETFATHAEMAFFMNVRGTEHVLPEEVKTALFRVAQEALTNIEKHAQAHRVELTLIFTPQAVRLTIADDGRGFDPVAVARDPQRGIGLRNMAERLAAFGGHCRIRSSGYGTRVVAQISGDALTRLLSDLRSKAAS